ncbi:MAG TPA: sulfite exporter TauE/SafE family protein [Acidimicrobiales bacterium]|nr:sulfite exporter TauE/SafE family protein [Acidimicrobiales bacterium]
MRVLLTSPLGFLIGVSLGALGGGGSVLAVPVLVYAAGQSVRGATTTSLLLVGCAALVGMGVHYRAGRVRVGTGVAFGLAGIGGSIAGSALNRHLNPDLLLLAFSGLVVIAAWRMLVGCPTCTRVGEERALAAAGSGGGDVAVLHRVDAATAAKVLAAGTVVGFVTGLFGVGGGFVIVPALTLVLGLSMPDAIGTSLLVIAVNSAVALSTRLATTSIDWRVALPFTIAAVAGVLTGKEIADRLDPKRSLDWFAVLLVGVAAYTAIRASMGLVQG